MIFYKNKYVDDEDENTEIVHSNWPYSRKTSSNINKSNEIKIEMDDLQNNPESFKNVTKRI